MARASHFVDRGFRLEGHALSSSRSAFVDAGGQRLQAATVAVVVADKACMDAVEMKQERSTPVQKALLLVEKRTYKPAGWKNLREVEVPIRCTPKRATVTDGM